MKCSRNCGTEGVFFSVHIYHEYNLVFGANIHTPQPTSVRIPGLGSWHRMGNGRFGCHYDTAYRNLQLLRVLHQRRTGEDLIFVEKYSYHKNMIHIFTSSFLASLRFAETAWVEGAPIETTRQDDEFLERRKAQSTGEPRFSK